MNWMISTEKIPRFNFVQKVVHAPKEFASIYLLVYVICRLIEKLELEERPTT